MRFRVKIVQFDPLLITGLSECFHRIVIVAIMINIEKTDNYFKDMFRHAYAIISLIE